MIAQPSRPFDPATLFATVMDARTRHHGSIDEETSMLSEAHNSIYEFHWMRHADRYLALVRTALEKDPSDLELRELLEAMEAAVAAKQQQPLH
jgi:valyl-tRNA synthetase